MICQWMICFVKGKSVCGGGEEGSRWKGGTLVMDYPDAQKGRLGQQREKHSGQRTSNDVSEGSKVSRFRAQYNSYRSTYVWRFGQADD